MVEGTAAYIAVYSNRVALVTMLKYAIIDECRRYVEHHDGCLRYRSTFEH